MTAVRTAQPASYLVELYDWHDFYRHCAGSPGESPLQFSANTPVANPHLPQQGATLSLPISAQNKSVALEYSSRVYNTTKEDIVVQLHLQEIVPRSLDFAPAMISFSVFVSVSALLGGAVGQLESNKNIKNVSSHPEPCAVVSSSSSSFYASIPTRMPSRCPYYYPFANSSQATTSFQGPADVAFACQLSAPFNQNLSVALIDYIVPYINFQSDLAYLKNPPSTYLMPAVDILGGLQDIRQNASAGTYTSQYAFDAAITDLVAKAHSGHFVYTSGLVSAFEYQNDVALISVSEDGLALPEVYVAGKSLHLTVRS